VKQRITTVFAIGVFALTLSGVAAAGPLDEGGAAAHRGDYAEAMWLWLPLAEQGNADAQADVALLYEKGQGVPRDDVQAAKWWQKAADQGHGLAQLFIGIKYLYGRSVRQDYVLAHMWFNLAASQGAGTGSRLRAADVEAIRDLAVMNRDHLAAKMTPEQIAEAQRLAREWKPK
jgi:TPR repeat protein